MVEQGAAKQENECSERDLVSAMGAAAPATDKMETNSNASAIPFEKAKRKTINKE